ncbi:metallophosphoesterase [Aquimarina sp. AU474]|uniref:metallophosphoesterase family protein n=1 Tax=Aquimarina sp. AU474 TaxID=2108529 RepID=UPI000D6A033B|nr:metallophosphoesterase [Aquimarina sp. AU474]
MIETIAHITDLHLDESYPFNNSVSARKRFDLILKDIEAKNITQIICTGDIGENKGVQYFFKKLKTKTLSLALGNHDKFIEILKYYNHGADYHSQKIYNSVLKKHHKFIFLDSSEGIIDNRQLIWLKKELKYPKPILIFIHHPILGLNLKVDEIGKLKNRDKVLSMLTKTTNKITIYCGHYHTESSLIHKNITQHITPAIAFQVKKSSKKIEIETTTSGYRIIQINKQDISSKIQLLRNAD